MTLTVRPDSVAFVSALRPFFGGVGFFIIALVFVTVVQTPTFAGSIVGSFVVLVAIAAVIALVYLRNKRIEVADGVVTVRNWRGIPNRIDISSVGDVVDVAAFLTSPGRTFPHLFVFDAQGTRLLRMRGEVWAPGTLESVVAALTASWPTDGTMIVRPITPQDFAASYPRSIGWWERSPVLLAFAIIIAIVAVTVILVFVFSPQPLAS